MPGDQTETNRTRCVLHPDRPGLYYMRVPCAPVGRIWVCSACKVDPDIVAKTFDWYRGQHEQRIATSKGEGNPQN